jgi:hypothetical protein
MYRSPSHLSEDARVKIAETLNARLADGLDLHSQIKVAHWNIKGPQFASLHPLFETFAVSLATDNDTLAERDGHARREGLRDRAARRQGFAPSRVPSGDHSRSRACKAARRALREVPRGCTRVPRGRGEERRHRYGRHPHRHHHGVREERVVPASVARGLIVGARHARTRNFCGSEYR